MPRTKTRADFSDAIIRGFINFSFHDYVAGRTLLMKNMPTQGTILGVTALEKLMKAICLLYDQTITVGRSGHALTDMATIIKAQEDALLTDDDVAFIEHIDKSYKLRYPDNLSADFDLYLPSLKILENLDRVYCKLTTSAKVMEINPEGKMYDVYIKQNQQLLINCNVHFNPSLSTKLSDSKQKYAHYVFQAGVGLKENFCWSNKVTHNGGWEKPEE